MPYPTPGQPGPQGIQGPVGPAGPTIDQFQQTILSWTGTQSVAASGYLNFFSMAGMAIQAGGTTGITLASGVVKFPAKVKWSQVIFSTRITGTVGGLPLTNPMDWRIQMRRPDGTTIIGSAAEVKISGTDISNRDTPLISFTLTATDPFTVDGIQIGILNGSAVNTINLTAVSVRVQRVINPEP